MKKNLGLVFSVAALIISLIALYISIGNPFGSTRHTEEIGQDAITEHPARTVESTEQAQVPSDEQDTDSTPDPKTDDKEHGDLKTEDTDMPDHVLVVGMGDTVNVDIDGDGNGNNVSVQLEKHKSDYGYYFHQVLLQIDGIDYSEAMYQARGESQFDTPFEYSWFITDLDISDGKLEIAIQDWGPSDDLTTSFFRFDGGRIQDLGKVEGFIFYENFSGSVVLNGDGTLNSFMRLHVLQTWWTTVQYAIGIDGRFTPVPQEFYTSNRDGQIVITNQDLFSFSFRGGKRSVLPAGTVATLIGTDDARWILLRLYDGSDVWLRLDPLNTYRIESPNGTVYSMEALSGLTMAD